MQIALKAIASNGPGRIKMKQFIIEHFGLLRVVVVICDIVNGALNAGDLKWGIPDPVPGHRVGF